MVTRQGFEKVSSEGTLVLTDLEVAQSLARWYQPTLQSLPIIMNPHIKDDPS